MSSPASPLQAVVDLFSGPLQGIRFADIDGEGLSGLASEVDALGNEVEVLEAQLTELRESLVQKQEVLLALAQQALAYARIYAESDEALTAELNEIVLPRSTKPRKGVKSPAERGAKAPKDDVDGSADAAEALSKPKRKGAATGVAPKAELAEVEPPLEAAAPAKGTRRKLPVRGRAAR